MLSVVPMVAGVAEEALARRAKNKQQAAAVHKPGQQPPPPAAAAAAAAAAAPQGGKEPLLVAFLREAQYLVGADTSGQMKKDMAALRSLLSPP